MNRYCRLCTRSYAMLESALKKNIRMQVLKVLHIPISQLDSLSTLICNPCKEAVTCMWDFYIHVQNTKGRFSKSSNNQDTNDCRMCGCSYMNFTNLIDDTSTRKQLFTLHQITIRSNDTCAIICKPCKDAVYYNWSFYMNAKRNQIVLKQRQKEKIGASHNMPDDSNIDEMDMASLIEKQEEDKSNQSILSNSEQCNDDENSIDSYNRIIELSFKPSLKCSLCPKKVKLTVISLIRHYEENHETTVIFPCKFCKKRFRNYTGFAVHLRSHKARRRKALSTQIKKKAHVEVKENENTDSKEYNEKKKDIDSSKFIECADDLQFQCKFCLESPNNIRELAKHYNEEHDTILVFPCKDCSQRFLNYTEFRKHRWNHKKQIRKPSPCYCICCRLPWTTVESRLKHETFQYAYLKDLQCDKCLKLFQTNLALKDHIKLFGEHHLFSCSFCTMSFVEWKDKTEHREAHDTNLAHTCRICRQNFVSLGKLSAHEMTHRRRNTKSPNRLLCVVCGAGFQKKSEIKEHLSGHNFHIKTMNSFVDLLNTSTLNIIADD